MGLGSSEEHTMKLFLKGFEDCESNSDKNILGTSWEMWENLERHCSVLAKLHWRGVMEYVPEGAMQEEFGNTELSQREARIKTLHK